MVALVPGRITRLVINIVAPKRPTVKPYENIILYELPNYIFLYHIAIAFINFY